MKYFIVLIACISISSCMLEKNKMATNNRVYAFRLHPNQDLKKEIIAFAIEKKIEAGYIITCVGSLKTAGIRFANQPNTTQLENKFEIVSLVGTFGASSGAHLHISIADGEGKNFGGHLNDGNLIYTTAEIVVGEIWDVRFSRQTDSITTYKELVVEPK